MENEKCIQVIDESHQPLAFVTVKDNQSKFISVTDDRGYICLEHEMLDSLTFSYVGYYSKSFSSTSLPEKVILKEKITTLREVSISKRKIRTETFGKFSKVLLNHSINVNSNETVLRYFDNNDVQPGFILEKMRLATRKHDKEFKLRISFYEHYPSNNSIFLNNSEVFYTTQKNSNLQEISLLPFNIVVPKMGFWVAIQSIGYFDEKNKFYPNADGEVGTLSYNQKGKVKSLELLSPGIYAIKSKSQTPAYTLGLKYRLKWSKDNKQPMISFSAIK